MEVHRESEATDSPIQGPHEALFLVLSYLPLYELLVITQVCRSLREALKNDILPWINILIGKPLKRRLNNEHLLNVASKAQGRLNTLVLLNCTKITDEGLQQVITRNPLISRLWIPACTSITPSAVIEAVKFLGKNNHRLKSLRIGGIYNIKKEDLGILHQLIDDQNQQKKKEGLMNLYHEYKDFSIFQHSSPAIDVDICPKCSEVQVVFDCPRDSCKRMRQQQKVDCCRGCKHCIPRCEECGICIKKEDPLEVACADNLCLDCWLKQPKCSFCNKPYCTQHADQQCSISDSSGFVCTDCYARFIESP